MKQLMKQLIKQLIRVFLNDMMIKGCLGRTHIY